MAGSGKTKIKELHLELFFDEQMIAVLQEIISTGKSSVELSHVYFRHLHLEELNHEGLKIQHLKLPVGRITKLKLKLTGLAERKGE